MYLVICQQPPLSHLPLKRWCGWCINENEGTELLLQPTLPILIPNKKQIKNKVSRINTPIKLSSSSNSAPSLVFWKYLHLKNE
jgi:hypothetical protein